MRAFVLPDFDTAPTVADVPTPSAGPGDVLVQVHTSSTNGIDLSTAAGHLRDMLPYAFPAILGKDFAGTVAAVGEDVSAFSPGDRVFGVVSQPSPLSSRAFAEYVVVPATPNLARIPEGLSFAQAGVLGLAGTTALDAIDAIAPAAGETVLVSGATGGVGSFAVQLAAARGATVIATSRPGAGMDLVRSLGAAHTVDFTGDVAAQVRTIRPDGVDAVIHLAGDGPALGALLVPGGRIASSLIMAPDHLPLPGRQVFPIFANPTTTALDRLAADVADGRLRPSIQRTYPLDQIGDAFADFASETLGKLAIAIA